jgi:hypothetical protein
MKRALAERAKQSLPNVEASPDAAATSQRPKKVSRLAERPAARNSRISSLTAQVCSTDNEEQSSFYLKHQNRALATELKSLQFAVTQLEHERDYRRQQCLAACQALNSLQATWTQLETALSPDAVVLPQGTTTSSRILTIPDDVPASTRTSTTCIRSTVSSAQTQSAAAAVEWTTALAEALAALGGNNSNHNNNHRNSKPAPPLLSNTELQSVQSQQQQSQQQQSQQNTTLVSVEQFYADLSQLSSNVAQRAQALQEWIWTVVLQPPPHSNETTNHAACGKQLAEAAAVRRMLETQLEECQVSLETTTTRERKLRRNLYRLAAGMLTTEQVTKALDDGSELEIAAQVKIEQNNIAGVVKEEAEKLQQQQQQQSLDSPQIKETITSFEKLLANRDGTIQDVSQNEKWMDAAVPCSKWMDE